MDGSWNDSPWVDDEADHDADEQALDAFDFFDPPADDSDTDDPSEYALDPEDATNDDAAPAMLFTLTNPRGQFPSP